MRNLLSVFIAGLFHVLISVSVVAQDLKSTVSNIGNNATSPQLLSILVPIQDLDKKNTEVIYPLGQIKSSLDSILNAYSPVNTYYFPFSENLKIKKAILHLVIETPAEVDATAVIGIDFNGSFLTSTALSNNTPRKFIQDIVLPADRFVTGWQNITINKSVVPSAQNICDLNFFINISQDSYVSLQYNQRTMVPSLSKLPYPFINPYSNEPVSLDLVLPKAVSITELLATLNFTYWLAAQPGSEKVTLNIYSINEFTPEKGRKSNIVFVGNMNQILYNESHQDWPFYLYEGQIQDKNGHVIPSDNGLVMMIPSPWNPHFAALAITGNEGRGLLKASQLFNVQDSFSLVGRNVAVVEEVLKLNKIKKNLKDWSDISFKDLGFSDQSVFGLGQQEINYQITLPRDKVPVSFKIKTQLSHTEYVNEEHRRVTLKVNNTPIGSALLSKSQLTWDVDPEECPLKPGSNTITYMFDLDPRQERCSLQDYKQSWATIFASSTLHITLQNSLPELNLKDFPVPFDANTLVIIPAFYSPEQMRILIQFYYALGMLFQAHPKPLEVRASSNVTKEELSHHPLIILGTEENNAWIEEIKKSLPLQVFGEKRSFGDEEGNQLTLVKIYSVGFIEEIISPWSSRYPALIISGTDNASFQRALLSFMDQATRQTMVGTLAVVNEAGKSNVLTVRHPSKDDSLFDYLNLALLVIYNYIKLYPSILIFMAALLAFIYFSWRNK